MNLNLTYGLAAINWSPSALVIAAIILLVGLLLIRFVVKTAFTLLKVALIVAIAAGAYFGLQAFI